MLRMSVIICISLFIIVTLPAKGSTESLRLNVSSIPDIEYTISNMPLKIALENVGIETIRILKFDFVDEKVFSIWFSIDIRRDDGTPLLNIPGGGKINLRGKKLEYISLEKGEGFYFQFNLANIIKKLDKGTYTISLEYHNQYGDNCFKGSIHSNAVVLEIKNAIN